MPYCSIRHMLRQIKIRKSPKRNRKCKHEQNGNSEMKNTIITNNNNQSQMLVLTAEWKGRGKNQ